MVVEEGAFRVVSVKAESETAGGDGPRDCMRKGQEVLRDLLIAWTGSSLVSWPP